MTETKKRLLITGGAGSVGRELGLSFQQKGYEVRAFDIPQADFTGLKEAGVEIIKGDITDRSEVEEIVESVDLVLHLAALLPPVSERDTAKTFAVNFKGTVYLVDAMLKSNSQARLVFASSVATYGDTTASEPPIRVDHPQNPNTLYSETKVQAEEYVLNSGIPYTILRVSGVVIPALQDPPEWPFLPDQRVEFINRADVVTAMLASVEQEEAANKIFNIAGGTSWQMRGWEFVKKLFAILDIPEEDAEYPEQPIYSDWYDTEESHQVLDYQKTSFPRFLELLNQAVEEALG